MKGEILQNYGWCQMIKKESNYYFKFNKGGALVNMSTFKISKWQADLSILNEIEAEKIVMSHSFN